MIAEGICGLRVLVVEDEALIAEELRERLTRLGATVVGPVDTAEAAVETAIRTRPDIVLMDIRLRGKRNGIAAANDIREAIEAPVVFLTSHSDRATLERAKESAPFGYVLKPFDERELLATLEIASHRYTLEQQLRESERRCAQMLRSIGDAVIAADLHGRIMFMNPIAEALTGWTWADAKGSLLDDVLCITRDRGGSQVVSPGMEALRAGHALRFDTDDLFLTSRSAAVIPIDDCASPIRDANGHITGMVMAFRDIRDRRLAEDALKRAQEELFQAQKMESIGRLASGIAHDFNNLLAIINGCAEMALEDQSLSDTTRTLLTDIIEAGLRGASVTRQFLAFGRKESLRPQSLDLNRLGTDLAAMLRRLIREDIELSLELAPVPVMAFADPIQVEQIIINLVVNARDAIPMAKGHGRITVGTRIVQISEGDAHEAGAEPGRYAVLTVRDTGTGIDEATREHIFEPYFTTKSVGAGSGLGLATVFGIAKQSGGSVTVRSALGQGATFAVYLPATPSTSTTVLAAAESGSHETILLVEDESLVRSLVAAGLRRKGYTVLEANDGRDALDVYARHGGQVRLVVTDVVMPNMLGPQLISRLRDQTPDLPAVYISGYASEQIPAIGDDVFIAKPFTPTVLAQKVRELLDR